MARKEAAAPVGNNDRLPGLRSRLSMCCVSVVDYRPAPVPLCAAIVPIAIALSLAPVQPYVPRWKAPSASKIRSQKSLRAGGKVTRTRMMHHDAQVPKLCSIVIVFAVPSEQDMR